MRGRVPSCPPSSCSSSGSASTPRRSCGRWTPRLRPSWRGSRRNVRRRWSTLPPARHWSPATSTRGSEALVLRFTNTVAFERRCIRSSFVALLAPYCYEYASVARLAGAAHRRSRCDTVFMKRSTKPRFSTGQRAWYHDFPCFTPQGEGGFGDGTLLGERVGEGPAGNRRGGQQDPLRAGVQHRGLDLHDPVRPVRDGAGPLARETADGRRA